MAINKELKYRRLYGGMVMMRIEKILQFLRNQMYVYKTLLKKGNNTLYTDLFLSGALASVEETYYHILAEIEKEKKQ